MATQRAPRKYWLYDYKVLEWHFTLSFVMTGSHVRNSLWKEQDARCFAQSLCSSTWTITLYFMISLIHPTNIYKVHALLQLWGAQAVSKVLALTKLMFKWRKQATSYGVNISSGNRTGKENEAGHRGPECRAGKLVKGTLMVWHQSRDLHKVSESCG